MSILASSLFGEQMTNTHPSTYKIQLEKQLNKWANSIAHEYNIEVKSFRISLKQHESLFQNVAEVSNGAVVHITLYLPIFSKKLDTTESLRRTVKELKKITRRVFNYITTPKKHKDDDFFNPLMISDVMHEYVLGSHGGMIWKKKRFDPTLVHGHRRREFDVDIQKTVTVTFTHKETGVSYTLIDDTNRREWDLTQECWEKCSELVELELGEDVTDVTPTVALVSTTFYENQAIEWLAITVQPERWVH